MAYEVIEKQISYYDLILLAIEVTIAIKLIIIDIKTQREIKMTAV